MRVMLLGATGLIGSAVAARLTAQGHEVVAVIRTSADFGLVPIHTVVRLDIARTCAPAQWLPHLAGVDAVINCAGVLQDSPRDSTAVHDQGIAALFSACEQAGVRRVVHLSAVGVDRDTPSEFSRSKLAGDRALMERDLDWVILRPSVVIGAPAYGASALMRGLASLPVRPSIPGTGPLQIVHLDDVAAAVLLFVQPDAPSRHVIEVVGPRVFSFDEAVALLRRWLRWKPARTWTMPAGLATVLYKLGDLAALLGWRPPVRGNTAREIGRGATGDPQPLGLFGLPTRDVEAALAATPASVQDRWFARLYMLKPIIFVVLPLFWIGTGIVSLTIGWDHGMGLMREGGVGERIGALTVIAGASADIAIGAAIARRRTARWGLWAAIAISLAYAVIGTVLVPRLWSDPLGPMLKIWPIIVLHFTALAILEDR